MNGMWAILSDVVTFASEEGDLLASSQPLAGTRHTETQAQNEIHHLIIRYTNHVKKEKTTSSE